MISNDAGATSSSINSPIARSPIPTLSPAPSLTLSPASTMSGNLNHRPFPHGMFSAPVPHHVPGTMYEIALSLLAPAPGSPMPRDRHFTAALAVATGDFQHGNSADEIAERDRVTSHRCATGRNSALCSR